MRQIKKIAMIGAGSWGTAVAKNIAESKSHLTVVMWAYEKNVAASINELHENTEYLPGIQLPATIAATNTLKDAVEGSDVVILSVPSKAAYDISQKMAPYITADMYVGFLTKGFCKIQGQVLTISQTMARAIPRMAGKIVAISGPSHAEEVSHRFHTCLNVGSASEEARSVMAELLSSEYVEARETENIRAVEVGGTLKNPAAIAAGMISALPRCGDNLAGALISEALKEMVRLGKIFGISEEALIDISGLGDLVATALSGHSRNRRFGSDIATQIIRKGRTLTLWDRIVLRIRPSSVIERMGGKMNYLAEGAYAIEPLIELAEASHVPIPVYRSLYEVLLNKKDPSLLIETIKNPAKYEEIFYNTKIQITGRTKGLEQLKGAVFKEMIIAQVMERFVAKQGGRLLPHRPDEVIGELSAFASSGSAGQEERRIIAGMTQLTYGDSMRRLIEMYTDSMADNYTPAFKWFMAMVICLLRFVAALSGRRGRLIVSGHAGEIKKTGRSANVIYVNRYKGMTDSLIIMLSIMMKNLPFPRFYVDTEALGLRNRVILKRCGGFVVDRSKLANPAYRETIVQYFATVAGHGVPMLYSVSYDREAEKERDHDEFLTALTECLYKHTAEVALVPVEVSYIGKAGGKTGYIRYRDLISEVTRINFSKPFMLSEYTRRPHMIKSIPDTVRKIWASDLKIFPHYIICKILASNDHSVRNDAMVSFAKQFMSQSPLKFDYTPTTMVKKGMRYLEKNKLISVANGQAVSIDRDAVECFAAILD